MIFSNGFFFLRRDDAYDLLIDGEKILQSNYKDEQQYQLHQNLRGTVKHHQSILKASVKNDAIKRYSHSLNSIFSIA